MINDEFLKRIKLGNERLNEIKISLKEKFIGIDDVIDKIIDNISLWYLTPELQFRPHIISLWGITGIGKTDLVRTLVKLLNFTDKFIEIQMDLKNDYSKNIENYLENSGVNCNEPSILLLDEIQRYRTINENGDMIENKYFNDIWMLLSDGKFQNNSQRRVEITEMILEEMYWLDRKENGDEEVPSSDEGLTKNTNKKAKNYQFSTSLWTASKFKKMLNLQISAEEIMRMSFDERMKIMDETLKTGNVNEGKSYEKLLIFISGNLDEAFTMAEDVEEIERDADIYNELSKRINIIHIKNALSKKFKPEQIARFGNNHIIYPCLNKESYYNIIKKNCNEILRKIESRNEIVIDLSKNIYDVIYRNGVFPAQGVRPVISTIYNLLGNNLPFFMYHALINNTKKITIDINSDILYVKINDNVIERKIILDIDNIRANKSIDEKMLVIVHEIGHALIYSVLFNTPPKQININSAGLENGFVINHSSIDNKTFIRNRIAIYLGGIVAEEIVFGEDFKSNGATSDILFATDIAAKYVRAYGMDGTISKIIKESANTPYESNYDVDKTNDIIENILDDEKKRAKDILNKNIKIYKTIINFIINNNGISVEQFLFICNNHGMGLVEKEINEKLIYSYDDKLKHFLLS